MATTRTTRTKTDRERAEEQADSVERDDNFQLPPGVSTKASRGEVETDTSEPEEEPLLTAEEQMAGGSDAQLEARSPAALAEVEAERAAAAQRSVEASARSAEQARSKGDTTEAQTGEANS
jgi:hypothetical protein